jgi:hypothetical protein
MVMIAILVLVIAGTVYGAVRYCVVFPRQPFTGPLAPLTNETRALAMQLETHVRAVASRPHNLEHPEALEAAACYIETTLKALGYRPQLQVYRVRDVDVRNIEVVIEPTLPSAKPAQTFVIGAHYDAPDDSPGANDNGTGVAALLELARSLKSLEHSQRLRLVFFVNEELPYAKTPDMGSYQHAKSLRERGEPISGMIALETLGHFSNRPGSQRFPFPFGHLYPDVGNFVAFVGMPRGRSLVTACVQTFRGHAAFPAIGGVAPAFIEGIDLSDHWAYDHFGFPACMVTDTAPFRNPFYHTPFDTPDTVDYPNLARVTLGLHTMILHLAAKRS